MVVATKEYPAYDELWRAWTLPQSDRADPASVSQRLGSVSLEDSSKDTAAAARDAKLAVYAAVVNFYAQEPKDTRFRELWRDLHSPAVYAFGLDVRMKRAAEGKEAANRKYKAGNWFGAMYTYALAWGCLLPFHYDMFAEGDEQTKAEFGKLECALFSNISAMATSAEKDTQLPAELKQGLIEAGIAAAKCCTAMPEVTCGIYTKSCRRAHELRVKSKIPLDAKARQDIKTWKTEEEKFKSLPADKLVSDVKK